MTTEELMKPRYKAIADYPYSGRKVGDVFHPSDVKAHSLFLDRYPHLFSKLEWWEERKTEDMPEYYKIDGTIYKWEREHGLKCCIARGHVLPATESEYNEYINKTT
jgi:hypothetical protein